MEGKVSSTSNDGMSSDDLNALTLEETFITLQTKGHSSQKFSLVEFLDKVTGGKVDDDMKLKTLSLLMSVNNSSDESKTRTDPDTKFENEKSNENVSVTENENTKFITGMKDISEKSKGRGRPRKVKIESHVGDEILKEDCSSSSSMQLKKDKDIFSPSKLKDQTIMPSLRRSSRVPTKNSKFKDDFVDSSIITSKGSASGDTRLMTLALAAECHTTKPNKQPIPFAKPQSSSHLIGNSNSTSENNSETVKQSDTSVTDKNETERNVKIEYNDDLINCHAKELNNAQDQRRLDRVLKRTLQSQLYLCVTETKSELSQKHITVDSESACRLSSLPFYYIITEPKDKLNNEPLLIQKCDEGFQFNIADMCQNVPEEQSNLTSQVLNYFKCNLCEKIFSSASQWQLHSKETHSVESTVTSGKSVTLEKEIHYCRHCNQKFPFNFMLENHLQKQEKCNTFSCQICNQKFSSQIEIEEHQTSSHSLVKCTACSKCFDDDAVLRKHLNNCHGVISPYDLDVSHKSLGVKEKLSISLIMKAENALSGQKEEVYRQREYNEMYELSESESVDRVGVKVGCEICGSKFSTYSGLWHHKLEIHQEYFPPSLKEKLEARLEKTQQMLSSVSPSYTLENRAKSNYFVIMKPKWYCSKMQLKVSMENNKLNFNSSVSQCDNSVNMILASGQPISLLQKGVLFYCNQCSTVYQSASEYREHRSKVHNECFETIRYLGAFQCTYCSDTFPCQFMLQEHLKQHTGRRLLPCTLCGLTFHKIQERRQHWKRVHPGVGCPNCGKMYASIKYLQKHISLNCQDHYPATKKFIAFRKKQHNDFDMDEKDKRVEKRLIKCHLCSKICSSVHGWRRHMSENHEDEGFSKLSNTCIICNEVIYGYKALEKHLLEVHAEDSGLPIEEENTIIKQAV